VSDGLAYTIISQSRADSAKDRFSSEDSEVLLSICAMVVVSVG
jgi:hypothetical protein